MKQSDYRWIQGVTEYYEKAFTNQTGSNNRAEFEAYAKDNMFFITMHVNPNLIGGSPGQSKNDLVLTAFKRDWYFSLCKMAFGNNLARKIMHQPIGFAVLDFNGSRAPGAGLTGLKSGPAHIHAVLMVKPGKGQEFKKALLEYGASKIPGITDIDIRPFEVMQVYRNPKTRFQKSLMNLIGYCSKGYRDLPNSYAGKDDCYVFLPA